MYRKHALKFTLLKSFHSDVTIKARILDHTNHSVELVLAYATENTPQQTIHSKISFSTEFSKVNSNKVVKINKHNYFQYFGISVTCCMPNTL
jgi:hypothetical protein